MESKEKQVGQSRPGFAKKKKGIRPLGLSYKEDRQMANTKSIRGML